MSLKCPSLKRLPALKEGLKQGLSHTEIGVKCGVTEKTIDRDVAAWINSGLFDQWIREEFVRLHPKIVESNPEIVYRELARLIGRTATQHIEASTKNLTVIRMWQPDESDSARSLSEVLPVSEAKKLPQRPVQSKA